MSKERVTVAAPGKLMLFGEHAVIYDRPCIVTAVDSRVNVSVMLTDSKKIQVDAPSMEVIGYEKKFGELGTGEIPKGARFIEAAVKQFLQVQDLPTGLRIETESDFSSKYGFGSSSAVTIGVLKALSDVFDYRLSERELFDLGYKAVLEVQEVGSGFDLAAATWGGVIYYVAGGKKVDPLNVDGVPLVVGYTGIKADTPGLVRRVGKLYESNKRTVGSIFDSMAMVVEEARQALERRDFATVGELMNINQGLLNALGVNTQELSNLVFAAKRGGAIGAKLSGAGGGDCMIALVTKDSRSEVEESIREAGGTVIDVTIPAEGVRRRK
jgi:mevalonate kinase